LSQNKPEINKPELKQLRKTLRNNSTPWERQIWSHLKNRKLGGYKFRRQTSIGNYIVDFICFELKLIIELDGSGHLYEGQKNKDITRQKELENWGYTVIRFYNNQVSENMEGVFTKITEVCRKISMKRGGLLE